MTSPPFWYDGRTMAQRFTSRIIKLLARRDYKPLKRHALAKLLNVAEADYGAFSAALADLQEQGKIVLGPGRSISLPPMPKRIVGTFQKSSRGFGFVTPKTATAQGDMFIPADCTGDAVTGDTVVARQMERDIRRGQRRGAQDRQRRSVGYIVEVVERATTQFVGVLRRRGRGWVVEPDGSDFTQPITVADVSAKAAGAGDKVLVEIMTFPAEHTSASGVIIEKLGRSGTSASELKGIIRQYGLHDKFSRAVLNDTRRAVEKYESGRSSRSADREDIRQTGTITIDPADAKDFDDAISLRKLPGGRWQLGVHIADVAHFVEPGSELDGEAAERGTSVYLPGRVVPMLPELLSNGICSLQGGQDRFVKSAYITLDKNGAPLQTRFANSLMRSTERLTYEDADRILDGEPTDCSKPAVQLVRKMAQLARIIERRRQEQGMLELEMPKAELIYDGKGHVVDARPESTTFSHKIIEMFMVEANEAVARLLDSLNVPFLRRIHPEPSALATGDMAGIVKVCGYVIPKSINRKGLQGLLGSVRGKPQSFLINLAVLKSLGKAEYSPAAVGHFALASEHYCHFTSPIRRYPDLTVHRLLQAYLDGRLTRKSAGTFVDYAAMEELADHCSQTERNAERAERELRTVKILQLLAKHIGREMNAVVTSIMEFGVFVQVERFLQDGLISAEDVDRSLAGHRKPQRPATRRSPRTGRDGQAGRGRFSERCPYKLGQPIRVRIAKVNVAGRTLDLVPAEPADT